MVYNSEVLTCLLTERNLHFWIEHLYQIIVCVFTGTIGYNVRKCSPMCKMLQIKETLMKQLE